jgi:hypothetical protein
MTDDYVFLFNKKSSSHQKAEMLGLERAQIMENMLTQLSPKITSKYGLYSTFMSVIDDVGHNFNYSKQEHSLEFIEWILNIHEFYMTDRGVVLREKNGIFRKKIVAEIFNYSELDARTPEYAMAKEIDDAGREMRKRESNRLGYYGGAKTRRISKTRRHKKTKRRQTKRRMH